MPLTQVIGWRGSGKTIFLILVALKYSKEVGKEIHANFSIEVSNYIKLKLTNLLYRNKNISPSFSQLQHNKF